MAVPMVSKAMADIRMERKILFHMFDILTPKDVIILYRNDV